MSLGTLAREQRLFLEQAVSGLAQEGKVICVRLALFAQMMKDRPWTPASLRGVGGTLGVGATFLEETFSAAAAPPEHRYHQEAARAILKALLPGAGTDIKGHMRSEAELLDASGYADRPRDFEDVLHILDGRGAPDHADRPTRATSMRRKRADGSGERGAFRHRPPIVHPASLRPVLPAHA